MAKILDGKATASAIKAELRAKTEELKTKGVTPALAVIIVGEDPASKVYVRNKKNDCAECGFKSEEYALPADYGMDKLISLIKELNNRDDIHGILVQHPLPKGFDYDEEVVYNTISQDKDVDAFHPANVGKIMIGNYDFLPCTPAGVMELLKRYDIPVEGKRCVVIGRSNIVGKPMAMLLMHANGTVTIAHSRTKDIASICREADIVVAALGKRAFVTADMVKPGAVVIDVGMNRNDEGKLCGDVDYAAVEPLASYITPVPGGVGPMTRAILMVNTLKACEKTLAK